MKILVHALSAKMGGAKRHLDNMMVSLFRHGSEHSFIVLVNNEYDTSYFDNKIETIRIDIRYVSGVKRIYFDNVLLKKIIKEHRVDYLLSFANFGPFKAPCRHMLFEMNALFFCKNIRHLYSRTELMDFAFRRVLIKLASNGADIVITPSESLKNQLVESLGVPNEKISVLHHAVEQRFEHSESSDEYFEKEKFSFLFPSHLARHKGVHTLVDAVSLLKKRNCDLPPFEIVCTFDRSDDPSYYDELKRKIAINSLENTIRFIGSVPQEKIGTLYEAADSMVYTTLCESFGFSIIEAKSFRLPILCSDIPINREIAKKSAIYFKPESPEELAEKIALFITEKPSGLIFEDDLLNWSWDQYSQRLLQLIKESAVG